MSAGTYLLGAALTVAVALSLATGAAAVRRRLLSAWRGATAALATAVLALAGLVVAAELLGVVGLMRRVPLTIACVVLGAAGAAWGRRGDEPTTSAGATERGETAIGWPARLLAAAACALVALEWATRSTQRLAGGMADPDTLWYHMPFAAGFAQSGFTTRLHFTQSEPSTTFHPASAELVHAIGISLFAGHDLLSPFVNLAFAALALLAAWAIGSIRGAGPASLIAVAALLVTPLMLQTQPGEAANDLVGVAFLLAACALLLHRAPPALVGLAAGLALGTKLSLLAPAALLCVLVPLAHRRGARTRAGAATIAAALAGGGFWYLRNLARSGNPLPWYALGVGPVHLPSPPMPETSRYSYSVAHYLTSAHVVRAFFRPALAGNLGRAWWALLALAAVGAIAAALTGERRLRIAAIVATGAALAYLVTPAGAGGPRDDPVLFGLNLRFATPALALGLALLPAALARRRLVLAAVTIALVAVVVVTQSSAGYWPTFRYFPHAARWWGPALAGGIVVAALTLRRRRAVLVAAVVVAAAAVGWPAQRSYERARYAEPGPTLGAPSLWAHRLTGVRIGFVGYLLHYPLYGPDDSNRVDYVGHRGAHGAFAPIATCAEWRAAVDRGRYRYLVLSPRPSVVLGPVRGRVPPPPELAWTRAAPGAREILADGQTTVLELTRPLDPRGCAAAAGTGGRAATVLRRG